MRYTVVNNSGTAIPRASGVKITGTYVDPATNNIIFQVSKAQASDAGILSAHILVTNQTLLPNIIVADGATDDDIIHPFNAGANPAGTDMYLQNDGSLGATPAANSIHCGVIAAAGSAAGTLHVSCTTSRVAQQTATGSGTTGGPETVTSGAVNPALPTSFISVTATQAYSLANGSFIGQRKRLRCTVAASTPVGVLTPATPKSFATITFNAVNQCIDLEWAQPGNSSTLGWYIVGVMGTPTIA